MDQDETAYAALAGAVEDARWAFGTGFADPLAGVDPELPAGVDGQALAAYCLMLGDDALVFSHRLQQWITRLPELEIEAAVANIALDLLGQSRRLLARAGQADGSERDEDDLAFRRRPEDFRCVRLVEPPITDFADLVVRGFIVAVWRGELMRALTRSADPVLAAVAGQAVKELDYHRTWAAGWVVRLGDGTPESQARTRAAVAAAWPYLPELFDDHPVERALPGVAAPAGESQAAVMSAVDAVLAAATLQQPAPTRLAGVGGRTGRDGGHTDHLSQALAELQSVARAYPDARW